MIDQPKTFTVPGIDQPLREQTLAEFVMVLDENHLVRRELRELQRRAAQTASLSARVSELEGELSALKLDAQCAQPMVPEPIPELTSAPEPPPESAPKSVFGKAPCRFCGKPINIGVGWGQHLRFKHPTLPKDTPQFES